jgi:amino acid transporter
MSADPPATATRPTLKRGLNLTQAIALNVANMVGIGPFITIPLFLAAMGGPHALIAWVIAAVLVVCDGLVWSELGAALPGSGGSYHYLKEIYGPLHPLWGQLMPFLFIWQFLISGTLEMASGYLGTVDYLGYVFPDLAPKLAAWGIPGGIHTLAAAACLLVTVLLCRRIEVIGWMGIALCIGTFIAVLTIIVSGFAHFNPALIIFPREEFQWGNAGHLAAGLGAAMQIAIYDYLGYYNVCHLGEEVRDPARTIPRAVIRSIFIVASIYFLMNVSIIGVVPWQEAMQTKYVAAIFMERLYGHHVAVAFTWLILWAVAAGMFAITLGYSRIPYAAARNGDFFSAFALLHPTRGYPVVSLWALGLLTAASCYFSLEIVISAAVTVRILVQFIGQILALHILRTTRPDIEMPFRMRLYPLASIVALCGWLFVLGTSGWQVLTAALGVTAAGLPVFLIWKSVTARRRA